MAAIRNGQSTRGTAAAGDESVVVLMNISSDAVPDGAALVEWI
jgi:hypothetical protein